MDNLTFVLGIQFDVPVFSFKLLSLLVFLSSGVAYFATYMYLQFC